MRRFVVLASIAAFVHAATPISSANVQFGHAIKNGPLPANTEVVSAHIHTFVDANPDRVAGLLGHHI